KPMRRFRNRPGHTLARPRWNADLTHGRRDAHRPCAAPAHRRTGHSPAHAAWLRCPATTAPAEGSDRRGSRRA
ncbi:hypothetical protein, partial [Escherichia coli]|uniref:hypothetical protein n=1 Tax=Escherichia coli TaxID=562 RepID=UPI0028DDE5F9